VWAGEVSLDDAAVEVLKIEAPEVGPVVDELSERVPEIWVLRSGLELDEHKVARAAQAEQVDLAGGEGSLPAHDQQVPVQSEVVRWDQLHLGFHHLLQGVLVG
jgi:hypothetical protein